MRQVGAIAMALALGSGCTLFPEGDGSTGYAPRITSSFPDSGTQRLLEDGSLTFSVGGEDDDSLELTWSWLLDDELQVAGQSGDGFFDEEWSLAWDPSISGTSVEVCFEVSDGSLTTELFWPVDVD